MHLQENSPKTHLPAHACIKRGVIARKLDSRPGHYLADTANCINVSTKGFTPLCFIFNQHKMASM